jgi:ribonuclease P protein component
VLPAASRLRRRQDFAAALRRGPGNARTARVSLVAHLAFAPAAAGEVCGDRPAKVGIVVSRSVGPAVERNRVKRRLRHLMRERLQLLAPNSTLVLRALPPAATSSYAALARDLDGALQRLNQRVNR